MPLDAAGVENKRLVTSAEQAGGRVEQSPPLEDIEGVLVVNHS